MSQQVLPRWFMEALDGEPTDNQPHKRSDTRCEWMVLAQVGEVEIPNRKKSVVKMFNVSPDGFGFVSRKHIPERTRILVAPDHEDEDGNPFEPLEAITVYSRQTLQGYKIGCSLL